MAFVLLLGLFGFITWLGCAEDDLGLSSEAVPSLVLLGTAKGGTTDLWYSLHHLKIGFEEYEASSLKRIETTKELNFFDGILCDASSHFNCSPEQLKILLRCPHYMINQSSISLGSTHVVRVCEEWLQHNHIEPSKYTMTAKPSLMRSHIRGSYAITSVASKTGAFPLYIVLLKDPVQRISSLYNHWCVSIGKDVYSLDLEEQVQLELSILAMPKAKTLLKQMLGASLGIKRPDPVNATELLTQHMAVALKELGSLSNARLSMLSALPSGLVLDGIYITQLMGWLESKAQVKNRLLIVKSEYVKDHREECIRDVFLPFLFPSLPQHKRDAVMNRAPLSEMQNQKPIKLAKSLLSPHTQHKLSRFYGQFDLESFLFSIQEKGGVKVVPSLRDKDEKWWPAYEEKV